MPINDVVIENTMIRARKGVTISNAVNVKLSKVRVEVVERPQLTLENVRNLSMDDTTIEQAQQ